MQLLNRLCGKAQLFSSRVTFKELFPVDSQMKGPHIFQRADQNTKHVISDPAPAGRAHHRPFSIIAPLVFITHYRIQLFITLGERAAFITVYLILKLSYQYPTGKAVFLDGNTEQLINRNTAALLINGEIKGMWRAREKHQLGLAGCLDDP